MNTHKKRRPFKSDIELNTKEYEWWETNGTLMSLLWDYDPTLNHYVRGKYIKKAKAFLMPNNKKPLHILELGCGSGWFGRMFNEFGVTLTGIDFSSAQIANANAMAANEKILKNFKYLCINDFEEIDELLNDADGVLIHAFLHHLDDSEINNILNLLAKTLKNGTRIWIYEPGFYHSPSLKQHLLPEKIDLKLQACEKTVDSLKSWLVNNKLIDRQPYDNFLKLWELSEKRGNLSFPQRNSITN